MGRVIAKHKSCGGPILEEEEYNQKDPPSFLVEEEFSVTCLTCLEEITDRSEIVMHEEIPQ